MFNSTHIYSIFSRIHIFQGPSSFVWVQAWSRFFRVQIFKVPCFSGSVSSVRIQVLEAALCIYMKITLRHRCSLVNLLHISVLLRARYDIFKIYRTIRIKKYFQNILKLFFTYPVSFHYQSINRSVEAATRRFSTKKQHCIFSQKLLEEVHVLVVLYV